MNDPIDLCDIDPREMILALRGEPPRECNFCRRVTASDCIGRWEREDFAEIVNSGVLDSIIFETDKDFREGRALDRIY